VKKDSKHDFDEEIDEFYEAVDSQTMEDYRELDRILDDVEERNIHLRNIIALFSDLTFQGYDDPNITSEKCAQ